MNNNQTYESLVIQRTYTTAIWMLLILAVLALATWPDQISRWLDVFGHWTHREIYYLITKHWQ